MSNIHQVLKEYFGFDQFRPQQEQIIRSVLEGNDVLALLPTGGGKSLCYQVPAMAKEGLCLVISPLIALMKDQVDHLRKKNITAFSLHSGMGFMEVKQVLKTAADSNCKFLYVSPERLQTRLFGEWLQSLNITLIAVDEAHCISQWGYDFRPTYLKIADIREQLPGVPVLALTASATATVQEDICQKLLFKQPNIFRQSFAKPNLSFSVFQPVSKYPKLKEILQNVAGCALVYCKNRRRTKEIAQLLNADGIAASFYHAGLAADERSVRQQDWISDKTRVMVCTNAFGMGIDKPNVRTVVHMDVPECQENYYQEAGRAGRDCKKSYAVLLYNARELTDMELLPDQRYPPLADIRKVYQSLCNYLQLPEGTGENEYYNFDIREFCERWKLDVLLVANVMKTLEQAGYIAFQENVFTPSKAMFTLDRQVLLQFENDHVTLEPVIKSLLRSYDGIFTNMVSINENGMAKSLRQPVTDVFRQLKSLALFGVIDYRPKKESPQVFFIYNRVHKDEIVIDHKSYLKRKTLFGDRLQAMIAFTTNAANCRSEILRRYFGEVQTEACGICDVCLRKKAAPISSAEVETAVLALKKQLTVPLKLDEIKKRLPITGKAVLEKAIQFLIDEKQVAYDNQARLFLKK